MPGEIAIQDLGDRELESDKIKIEEIKLKVREDYYRRATGVLESSSIGVQSINQEADDYDWCVAHKGRRAQTV